MSKGEADEKSLVHWFLAICHDLERHLLVMDFLVLGHVSLVAEVVKVAGVGLGVELWHEWRTLGAESLPIDLGKVLVSVDLLDVWETLAFRGNEANLY